MTALATQPRNRRSKRSPAPRSGSSRPTTGAAQPRRFGAYILGAEIASGGMGVVYMATHATLKRPAAVKILPRFLDGKNTRERFKIEAQLTSRLTHPNTVSIYDYGCTRDGTVYYVMEYLDGINLADLVRQHGPQPPARVLHIIAQVAGALAEAHSQGLIHRDIKPANVILCRRGGMLDVAKIVDFGLVTQVAERPRRDEDGFVTGTPGYLAPEAIMTPDRVDTRTDVYALGALGYFLLTGTPVFTGDLLEICDAHVNSDPTPPSVRLGRAIPPSLESIILKCLARDPNDRPADGRELRDALDAVRGVGSWGQERARGWWNDHEARFPSLRAPKRSTESWQPTASIGLAHTISVLPDARTKSWRPRRDRR